MVGVDVTSDWKLETQVSDIEDKSLWWLLGRGRKEAPNIVRILTRSGTISGDVQTAANRAAADVLIHPELDSIDMWSFRALDKAIELGYGAAAGAIEQIKRGWWSKRRNGRISGGDDVRSTGTGSQSALRD